MGRSVLSTTAGRSDFITTSWKVIDFPFDLITPLLRLSHMGITTDKDLPTNCSLRYDMTHTYTQCV